MASANEMPVASLKEVLAPARQGAGEFAAQMGFTSAGVTGVLDMCRAVR
jgi:hypothetical protein